jgi:hypothetical protein
MLSFRNGTWSRVPCEVSDVLFSEEHKLQAAAIIATNLQKGLSQKASTAEAERILYQRLFPGLVFGKEHSTPKD